MAGNISRILRLTTIIFLNLASVSTGFQISGISAGVDFATGARPSRQEINQFAGAGPAFDLFILALAQLQKTDQAESLSYFQISGIHGYPRVPWDNVVGNYSNPGYCMHACAPFLPWHRPYVALYEQVLWEKAQAIAQNYSSDQRDTYVAAAATFRVPYWDWASQPYLPSVVATPQISIMTPNGLLPMDNPLYNYTFLADAAGNGFPSGDPMASFPWTVRQWDPFLQQSNQTQVTASLMANGPNLLAMTYQIFTSISDYAAVCTTSQPYTANNIENIHNSIHNSIGGYGHMSFPEVAAFDPIFWLHHANVDRVFAIWQALNPKSYIQPTVNAYGTYAEPAGFTDSGSTSLAPFHSDNGTAMYTSDDVRDTLSFGYTYPELQGWNTSAPDPAAQLRTQVNILYNPFTSSTRRAVPQTKRVPDITQAFSHITFEMAKNLGVNNRARQWSIQIQIERFAYETAFAIDFFMGDPPEDPTAWATAPNLIGSHAQFIAQNVSKLHPAGAANGLVHGEVSLTHSLAAGMARGAIKDLNPQTVIPLLQEHLHWRARTARNCEIEVGSLSGLSISVASRNVRPARRLNEFPVYDEFQRHADATHGKLGGLRQCHRLAT